MKQLEGKVSVSVFRVSRETKKKTLQLWMNNFFSHSLLSGSSPLTE